VHPYVVFGPGVSVGEGAEILPFCHLAGASVGAGAKVGPFARLRPGADLAEQSRIGNFVEVKASRVGRGAKANHLAYIGDSDIGPGANIGAGTITCNYDGLLKHPTVVGDGAFIGSNTALVAPVRVGGGAIIGAGSVITRDVAPGAIATARGEQTERPGAAARFRERRRKDREQRRTGKI
jgi:bifunctional UDP-N-acetylglucosamine pyrophosphorylase/glucosamine-1-phosphate N-acetyltransferase